MSENTDPADFNPCLAFIVLVLLGRFFLFFIIFFVFEEFALGPFYSLYANLCLMTLVNGLPEVFIYIVLNVMLLIVDCSDFFFAILVIVL